MKEMGDLVIISGFSGVGKGTAIASLMRKHDHYVFSVSATTRKPRPGESDGKDYFFLSREGFEQLIREERLLEYTSYQGNYYGTPRDYVDLKRNEGLDVILDIEVEGALNVKRRYPDALLIYLIPPSAGILADRLRNRGTESEEQICGRLQRAAQEAELIGRYDAVVVNDRLEDCVEDLHRIIQQPELALRYRQDNLPLAEQIRCNLKTMTEKGE